MSSRGPDCRLLLVDDEPAADRVVHATAQLCTVAIEGQEHHAVAVKVHGAQRQNDIGGVVELDRVRAGQQQLAARVDLLDPGFRDDRIDRLGFTALQPEDDRAGRAVSGAGSAQRAVELDPYPRHVRQQPVVGEMTGEPACGAHGPDGVRARRPDADGEQIKD